MKKLTTAILLLLLVQWASFGLAQPNPAGQLLLAAQRGEPQEVESLIEGTDVADSTLSKAVMLAVWSAAVPPDISGSGGAGSVDEQNPIVKAMLEIRGSAFTKSVGLLLDAGADPNRYKYTAHSARRIEPIPWGYTRHIVAAQEGALSAYELAQQAGLEEMANLLKSSTGR